MSSLPDFTGSSRLSLLAAVLACRVAALNPSGGVLIVLLACAAGAGGLILLAARLYKQPNNP